MPQHALAQANGCNAKRESRSAATVRSDAATTGALCAAAAQPAGKERDPAAAQFIRCCTDADLLARSISDPSTFGEIFSRHVVAIHRYLVRRVGVSPAEDLVADTFAVAFDQRARYRSQYPDARPWLFGIATNLMRHHCRTERARLHAYARVGHYLIIVASDVESEALSRADASASRGALEAAMTDLRIGDRDALLLMAWGELSYEEISRALRIPIGTVRSRINRSRWQLRNVLNSAGDVREPVSA